MVVHFGISHAQNALNEYKNTAEKENQLKRGGRPKKEIQAIEAVALHKGKRHTIDEICDLTGLSKSSLYRALAETYEQEEKEHSEDGDQD